MKILEGEGGGGGTGARGSERGVPPDTLVTQAS